MSGGPRTGGGERRFRRRLVGASLTAGLVLLPALVAGSRIAAPPTPLEVARLRVALGGPTDGNASISEVARQFSLSTLWPVPAAMPDDPEGQAAVTSRARFAEVGAVLGLSLTLYTALLLARGRVQALLGCAGMALLPPVFAGGHVLRPEAPAALFALLATVLLQCLAQPPRVWSRRGVWHRAVNTGALALCVSVASALAVATLPAVGECLLVSGIVLVLAALQLGVRAVRILRRDGLLRLPIRAINQRLLPWTLVTLLAPAMTLLLLTSVVPGGAAAVTPSEASLLPQHGAARLAVAALVLLGSVAGVLRTGLRFGRGGRIGADVVLLVYCGAHLAAVVGEAPGADVLPAVPALAIVVSEGVFAAIRALRYVAGRVLAR